MIKIKISQEEDSSLICFALYLKDKICEYLIVKNLILKACIKYWKLRKYNESYQITILIYCLAKYMVNYNKI